MILRKTVQLVWGKITGNLADQTDLQDSFNLKSNVGHIHGGGGEAPSHAELSNLGFDSSGHTGFQRAMSYDGVLGSYLV